MAAQPQITLQVASRSNSEHALVSQPTLDHLGLPEGGRALIFVGIEQFPVTVAVGKVANKEILVPQNLEHVRIGRHVTVVPVQADLIRRAQPESTESNGGSPDILKAIVSEKPDIHFEDIAGMDDAKEKIRAVIIDPYDFPDEYAYYHRKSGGGILLYGPPGCGKTYLAAAAAADSDCTFLSLKGSDIKDMFVGQSERNISRIFNLARQGTKTIIFLDEIDTILPSRVGAAAEHEKSLVGEFLAQMDGLEEKGATRNYLVLVATNIPWVLDLPLRDRFDTVIFIPHPDLDARRHQLELHLRGRPIDVSVDLDRIAEEIDGLSGRQIERLCNKACDIPLRKRINALRNVGFDSSTPRQPVAMADFEQAMTEVRSVLPSWYREALDQLNNMTAEEREGFEDLIRVGEEYLKDRESRR
jgi:SpoVK/Ycf46/Vps4 family AAA+-type ATPase